ncbi:MAG: transposase [Proteobacteria bacterium]|nr:transposase [Pseudomonadota bacterium]
MSDLPEKCRECAKAGAPAVQAKCDLCRELEIDESTLCDLNRGIQDSARFRCHAFQPRLKIAGPSGDNISDLNVFPKEPKIPPGGFPKGLLDSDKIKYQRALARQKLDHDPEEIFVELKYHLLWNVAYRRPVFRLASDFVDIIGNIFFRCSDLAGGFVSLLSLAPDHVHIYVVTNGEHSIESIVRGIKEISEHEFSRGCFDGETNVAFRSPIWDSAYLAETIG